MRARGQVTNTGRTLRASLLGAAACLGGMGAVLVTGTAPAAAADDPPPTITSPADGSSGQATAPVVSGTGTARSTVIVTASEQFLCAAIVKADGSWQCRAAASLNLQTYVLSARQLTPDNVLSESSPGISVTIVAAPRGDDTPSGGSTSAGRAPAAGATGSRADTTDASGESGLERQKPLAIAAIAGLALTVCGYAFSVMRPGGRRGRSRRDRPGQSTTGA